MGLNAGEVIADRYRLSHHIATGGMGAVWEAVDTRLDRAVAIKVLKPEFSADGEFLDRFRAEARTTAQLNHPGIANVFDYGETVGADSVVVPYLVMELVRGEPLNAVIRRMGAIDPVLVLDMLEQSGRALQAAHDTGLVHRDVKPGNILITPTGQVKITDFGIAKAVDAAPVTRAGLVMGTAQYISPEQALGEEATPASDVYALGVVGYEALTGRRPFAATGTFAIAQAHISSPPDPLPETVPGPVRDLIAYAMTKDPGHRYPDGGSFADAVAAVRAGGPPLPPADWAPETVAVVAAADAAHTTILPTAAAAAPPPPPPPLPPPPPTGGGLTPLQRNMAIAAAVLLLLAGLIALGIVLLGGSGSESPPAPTTTTTTTKRPTTTAAPTTTETTTEEPTTTAPPTTVAPTTAAPTTTEPPTTPEPTTEEPPSTTEPSPEPEPEPEETPDPAEEASTDSGGTGGEAAGASTSGTDVAAARYAVIVPAGTAPAYHGGTRP